MPQLVETKTPLLVRGMHGLGDNLHQRALLRQLMRRHEIFLESSWVAPYHDLIEQGLHVIPKRTPLRTQSKNADREAARFSAMRPPATARHLDIWYRPAAVRRTGAVLAAMCEAAGCDPAIADFRLPVKPAWVERARSFVGHPNKPILVLRPLVERTEWNGCAARNPDHSAYAELFTAIRGRFHVVSIADLVPKVEWSVGEALPADQTFHRGELEFEALAGLISIAALTFCSPGFAVILSQAVGTPVICTFGGYERGYSFSAGARFTPYLPIEPIHPRDDFQHDAEFDKSIDIAVARAAVELFAGQATLHPR